MTLDPAAIVVVASLTAFVGTLGGLGGAVLLVPLLVATGTDPLVAAPIGLVTVAAGALAAAPTQLQRGLVHHRLGLTIEVPASTAALAGALLSVHASPTALRLVLAATALGAGLVGLTRGMPHNVPTAQFVAEPPAEWPGTLGGTYNGPGGAIPYRARRVPIGLAAMVGAGAISGLAGIGGGFVKTPVMREIMWIPVKVAAATSTFSVGITATTTLIVFAGQGRLDPVPCAAAGVGGLVGGVLGAHLQERLAPNVIRRVLGILLVTIAAILVAGV